MIHKACMPVYMNSGKIVAGRDGTGRDGWTGKSKVLQEVLMDLKIVVLGSNTLFTHHIYVICYALVCSIELESHPYANI